MILVVAALAVYRITRLITTDTILDRPRIWLGAKADWLETLLTCVWCMGFWISVFATIGLYATGFLILHAFVWVLLPFALSAIAGIIDSWV